MPLKVFDSLLKAPTTIEKAECLHGGVVRIISIGPSEIVTSIWNTAWQPVAFANTCCGLCYVLLWFCYGFESRPCLNC